jgi:hypothetical protein
MPLPPCRSLGQHCRALKVTMRVAALEGGEDHDATWLFGHTERLDFGATFEDDDELWVEATIHVPCRYLKEQGGSAVRCGAYGYEGRVNHPRRLPAPRRLGGDTFRIVEKKRLVTRSLHAPARMLPVLEHDLAPDANPCATAPCRTADHTRKAACCRDLQVEIKCTEKEQRLEALLRTRKSPYLCKVEREDEGALNAEIISACSYLMEDGLHCDLHGRLRADGRPAKPLMCSHWPEKRTGLHPGCAFRNRRIPL